jgi:hypothetical protein
MPYNHNQRANDFVEAVWRDRLLNLNCISVSKQSLNKTFGGAAVIAILISLFLKCFAGRADTYIEAPAIAVTELKPNWSTSRLALDIAHRQRQWTKEINRVGQRHREPPGRRST